MSRARCRNARRCVSRAVAISAAQALIDADAAPRLARLIGMFADRVRRHYPRVEFAEPTEVAILTHKPIADKGCVTCHDPHASSNKFNLVKAPGELCASCHKPVSDGAAKAKFKHRPIEQGGCTACHDAGSGHAITPTARAPRRPGSRPEPPPREGRGTRGRRPRRRSCRCRDSSR